MRSILPLIAGLALLACTDSTDSGGAAGGGGSPSNSAGSSGAGATGAGASNGGAANGGQASGGKAGESTAGKSSGGNGAAGEGGAVGTADYWKPKAGLTWQWQLSEAVEEPLEVEAYDIDWEADASEVQKLHAVGVKVICYVSVGSREDFRPDADDFPDAVIGNDYDGWPGEKYVDIRSDAVRAVMSARFDVCQQKGFDAVEPDNQDVFELGDESGFPLTEADGIAYAKWLAEAAHSRGMSIGQKNAPSITDAIVDDYDWALTESCFSDDDWCGDVKAYVDADKPVLMCEYESASFDDACSTWKSQGYSPILKGLDLDAPITFCP